MKINDIYDILNEYAPFALSDKLVEMENGYDNSGILVPVTEDITGIVFSLDLNSLAVEKAKKEGYNLIITHHPAIYHPIKTVEGVLLESVRNKIGVISCHLNLDCAKRGIDYYFAEGLGAQKQEILMKLSDYEGYGRRFFVGKSLGFIKRRAEETFNTTVLCYGYDDMHVNYVASFCGAGLGEKEARTNCDLLCSSDVPHHVILNAVEQGKAVLVFTHYSCENYGFKKLYEHFLNSEKVNKNVKLYFFDDNRLF